MTKPEIDIRMGKARAHLIQDHAFFGALAMRLTLIERLDVETMATDGKYLFYSRKFLDSITEEITDFGVAHEVLHCALGHHTRRGGRDPKLWNIACDHAVNLLLKDAGFNVPKWAYCDPAYKGLSAEQIFRILAKKKQEEENSQSQPGQGESKDEQNNQDQNQPDDDEGQQPEASGSSDQSDEKDNDEADNGQGSGDADDAGDDASNDQSSEGDESSDGDSSTTNADGSDAGSDTTTSGDGDGSSQNDSQPTPSPNYPPTYGDPGRCGEILDAAPEHDKASLSEAADEWQVYTRQAANVARRQGEGKLPGFIEEIVDVLNAPQTDWRTLLHRFVDPQTSTKDYTWTQPNRRFMSMGFYIPGLISDGVNHIVAAVDSSASVDYKWLQSFGCEGQALLDEGAVDKVTLMFIDTQINKITEYVKGDIIDFTVLGRGGTCFVPAFEWVNENVNDVSAMIYFTDLECSEFGPEPSYPVLWVVHGSDPAYTKQLMERVPFGECVELVE